MNLDTDFPLKYYLNLNKREDRRRNVINALLDHGMEDVKRLPAVDGRWAKHARGYQTPTRYAHALTHKMAIWRARQKKAPFAGVDGAALGVKSASTRTSSNPFRSSWNSGGSVFRKATTSPVKYVRNTDETISLANWRWPPSPGGSNASV